MSIGGGRRRRRRGNDGDGWVVGSRRRDMNGNDTREKEMVWFGCWIALLVVVGGGTTVVVGGANVSYDGRSLIIDGQRTILFSGSIHYARSTQDMWPSLIAKAKQGGLDVIQTYVFWNLHEPQPGQINTCNGMRCEETWRGPNSPNKPSLWTENWTSFLQGYGDDTPMRKAEDLAFHTTLFIIRMNGTFVNYYMYGILRQPKYGHLKEMHAALKQCLQPLLYGDLAIENLGQDQDAYVYTTSSGECAAFLINNNTRESVEVEFRDTQYHLPAKSISILPDCKSVVFNTAMVSTQVSTRSMQPIMMFGSTQQWEAFSEIVPQFDQTSLRSDGLLEQMNTTKDTSDYLWYTFRMQNNFSEAQPMLRVNSNGHVLRAYVNGALVGSAHGTRKVTNFIFENTVSLSNGINNISLLSAMVGLPVGAFMESRRAGLQEVLIQEQNFTSYLWGYQVGLLGERLSVYTNEGSRNVTWSQYSSPRTLTWYKTVFDSPSGNDSLALNLGSMGKGEVWINGQSIGRYWVSFKTPSGSPSQTWYNVPRSFLTPTENLLVLFEEENGNPLNISLDTVSINKVCGLVSDSHPPRVYPWGVHHPYPWRPKPKVHLWCPHNRIITRIIFASHGNPSGNCKRYSTGKCHSPNAKHVVEKACLGKRQCSISHTIETFGGDPCPGTPKTLLVDALCE
ncbi:hypothetical protein L1887_35511 [Cichorium endivia]|nr:hypothetical protein L1887_35511 [Cichorium endivia]